MWSEGLARCILRVSSLRSSLDDRKEKKSTSHISYFIFNKQAKQHCEKRLATIKGAGSLTLDVSFHVVFVFGLAVEKLGKKA